MIEGTEVCQSYLYKMTKQKLTTRLAAWCCITINLEVLAEGQALSLPVILLSTPREWSLALGRD